MYLVYAYLVFRHERWCPSPPRPGQGAGASLCPWLRSRAPTPGPVDRQGASGIGPGPLDRRRRWRSLGRGGGRSRLQKMMARSASSIPHARSCNGALAVPQSPPVRLPGGWECGRCGRRLTSGWLGVEVAGLLIRASARAPRLAHALCVAPWRAWPCALRAVRASLERRPGQPVGILPRGARSHLRSGLHPVVVTAFPAWVRALLLLCDHAQVRLYAAQRRIASLGSGIPTSLDILRGRIAPARRHTASQGLLAGRTVMSVKQVAKTLGVCEGLGVILREVLGLSIVAERVGDTFATRGSVPRCGSVFAKSWAISHLHCLAMRGRLHWFSQSCVDSSASLVVRRGLGAQRTNLDERRVWCAMLWPLLIEAATDAPPARTHSLARPAAAMGSVKTFKLKKHLAKRLNMNRPLPQWFRMKTGTNIRYNKFRRRPAPAQCSSVCHRPDLCIIVSMRRRSVPLGRCSRAARAPHRAHAGTVVSEPL